MKTFIGLRCNKHYVKKTGRRALYLLVGIEKVFDKIPLDLDWPGNLVDEDNNQLLEQTKGDKDCSDYNLIIRAAMAKVNEIFIQARLKGKELTMPELMDMYYHYLRRQDFMVYMNDKIKERYKRKKIAEGTKKSHVNSWLWLHNYRQEIPFQNLDKKFIENFEGWLQRQNNRRSKDKKKLEGNTIANILKYIKAYINLAIEDQIPITNAFDSADVKVVQDTKMIEHLKPKEVARLIEYYNQDIPIGEKLTLCRLLIACHLSLRISDILKLDHKKLEYYQSVGKLIFHPKKQVLTKKLKTVFVPIDELAMKYLEDCVALQDLAKLKNLNISEAYGRKVLKKIAGKTKVNATGFHIGRHTFGTNYIRFGGKVTNLQYIMGHSNINTTMRYVHIVDEDNDEDMVNLSKGYQAHLNEK